MKRCSQMAGLGHCPSNVSLCQEERGFSLLYWVNYFKPILIFPCFPITVLAPSLISPALQKQRQILLKDYFSNAQYKIFAYFTESATKMKSIYWWHVLFLIRNILPTAPLLTNLSCSGLFCHRNILLYLAPSEAASWPWLSLLQFQRAKIRLP